VFTLEAQEGRLFKPLAYTKTFAMAGAALLSLTLVPALMCCAFAAKSFRTSQPLNRFLIWAYRPLIAGVMRWKKLTILLALLILAASYYPASRLGSEFMPTSTREPCCTCPPPCRACRSPRPPRSCRPEPHHQNLPEVASVYGKAGRAATATDPAPLEMFETVINLKPEREWRSGMTMDTLIAELDQALQIPGVSNAWTMPIKARTDMLSTGIRTPIGIKVFGNDLAELEQLAKAIEAVVKTVPGTTSAYAERITGGYYLNIEPDRAALARYGLGIGDVQEVIATALGGETVTPPSRGGSVRG